MLKALDFKQKTIRGLSICIFILAVAILITGVLLYLQLIYNLIPPMLSLTVSIFLSFSFGIAAYGLWNYKNWAGGT